MWSENGVINRDVIAKKAHEIAKLAGLKWKHLSSKFLMVEEKDDWSRLSIFNGKAITRFDSI